MFRHNELPKQTFIIDSRNVQTTTKFNINKGQMDREQHIPEVILKAKPLTRKYVSMAFYNEKEQLYLGTDALGVGLRAILLTKLDKECSF